jgi:hypothetical protein
VVRAAVGRALALVVVVEDGPYAAELVGVVADVARGGLRGGIVLA